MGRDIALRCPRPKQSAGRSECGKITRPFRAFSVAWRCARRRGTAQRAVPTTRMIPLILSVGGGWKDWFPDIGQTFLDILESFQDTGKRRQDVWEWFRDVLAEIPYVLKPLQDILGSFQDVTKPLPDILKAFPDVSNPFLDVWAAFLDI